MVSELHSLRAVMEDLLRQKESILLEQMGKLLRDGVLVIEETKAVLIREPSADKFRLEQAVRLTYVGEKKMAELKAENEILRAKLAAIRDAIGPIKLLEGE